jgi:hypothetical protein
MKCGEDIKALQKLDTFLAMVMMLFIGGVYVWAWQDGKQSEPSQEMEVITVYEERCFSEEAQYLDEMVSAHEHFKKMRSF